VQEQILEDRTSVVRICELRRWVSNTRLAKKGKFYFVVVLKMWLLTILRKITREGSQGERWRVVR
jgi:hypothetical protein